ncbi:unnamed protein product [Lampetra planeri]
MRSRAPSDRRRESSEFFRPRERRGGAVDASGEASAPRAGHVSKLRPCSDQTVASGPNAGRATRASRGLDPALTPGP